MHYTSLSLFFAEVPSYLQAKGTWPHSTDILFSRSRNEPSKIEDCPLVRRVPDKKGQIPVLVGKCRIQVEQEIIAGFREIGKLRIEEGVGFTCVGIIRP